MNSIYPINNFCISLVPGYNGECFFCLHFRLGYVLFCLISFLVLITGFFFFFFCFFFTTFYFIFFGRGVFSCFFVLFCGIFYSFFHVFFLNFFFLAFFLCTFLKKNLILFKWVLFVFFS